MPKSLLCSLFVQNLKNDTRVISRSVIGPRRGGMVHFDKLKHLKYAIKLEEKNEVEIKTPIPDHVQQQLDNADGESFAAKALSLAGNPNNSYPDTAQDASTLNETAAIGAGDDGVIEVDPEPGDDVEEKEQSGEEDQKESGEENNESDSNENPVDEDGEEVPGEEEQEHTPEDPDIQHSEGSPEEESEDSPDEVSDSDEKPEWYLTYEQVESMTKTQIIEHFENVEEINIPKSKNAGETKEFVHEELGKLFEDHQA